MVSALNDVYQNSELTDLLPAQAFTEGFIFAIAAAPEIPMPEKWMPALINGRSNHLESTLVDKLADALMFTLRDSLKAMRDGSVLLPRYVVWTEDKQSREPAEQWLTGLLAGHQFVEDCWQQAWRRAQLETNSVSAPEKETPSKRLTRCLKLFSSLADTALALSVRTEEQAKAFRQHLPALYQQLPLMLKEYVVLADQLAASLPNQFETFAKSEQ